jgi:hypothetical protein
MFRLGIFGFKNSYKIHFFYNVTDVKVQESNERNICYLLSKFQGEVLSMCGAKVLRRILEEWTKIFYFFLLNLLFQQYK